MSRIKCYPVLLLLLLVLALAFQPAYSAPGTPAAAHPSSTFTPPVNVSASPDSSQRPRLARDTSGTLHAVWQEAFGPAYTKGDGTTWQPWEWIVPPGSLVSVPVLALDDAGNAHVAMIQGKEPSLVVYTTRPITGSWSAPLAVSQETYNTPYPTIAVDGSGGVWVAWPVELSDTNIEIYARYRPAGGDWGPLMRVTDNAAADLDPSLAVGRGDVAHLAWRSNSAGVYDIFYSRFEEGGWGPAENVSETGFYSIAPDVAADAAGNVYVAWADEMGGLDHFQILCRRWDGSSWWPWTHVSATSSPRALSPALAADGDGNLYAVWADYRDDLAHPEVYFSHSTNFGTTWLGDENVTQNATSSYYPDVAARPGGYAHIVWTDMAPGQPDIYYSRAGVQVEVRFYLPVVAK